MNGQVIASMIDRIAKANGSAEEELKKLIANGEITPEEAAVINLRASLTRISASLDSAIAAAS